MSHTRRLTSLLVLFVLLSLPATAFAAPPSNDSRADATEIQSLPYATSQDVDEATAEGSDPNSCYGRTDDTVWYRYTAAADDRLVASTAGSSYNTSIEVLERSGAALSVVACAGPSGPAPRGAVTTFPVTAGRTYLFVVGRLVDHTPPESRDHELSFALRVQPDIDVDIDESAFVNTGTGAVTLTGTAVCSDDVSVEVQSGVRQGPSRDRTYAWGTGYVECTDVEQPFVLRLQPPSRGKFGAGRATLEASIHASAEDYGERVRQDLSLTACTMIGTAGDDVLRGTSGADRICGLQGDDEIVTGRGNDVVYAGPGRDLVRLGSGNDWVAGGDGADRLLGNSGRDVLLGDAGRDRLVGGKGYDRCTGGTARDTFRSCEARRS